MSDKNLIAKIEGLKEKYAQLQEQLADPELMNDMKKFVKVNKEYKELTPVLETGGRYKKMVEGTYTEVKEEKKPEQKPAEPPAQEDDQDDVNNILFG